MKTISSRFLKASLAMLLVVVMLFGSTITGFAASVDNADTKANIDNADTSANVDIAETKATTRYIYVGISNNYYQYKDNSNYGFNFWGGSNGGVKSGTYLTSYTWDGRKYYMYRVQVSDDNNMAQFKGNSNWWDPSNGYSVKLNGTTNNAIFFSHSSDGWQGQFQQNYQETSTGKVTVSNASVPVGTAVTFTPSLTSNATYNEIKSTKYSVNGTELSNNTFTPTSTGSYTVTATITYNPKYFTGITKTVTATATFTATQAGFSYTATAGEGGTVSPTGGTATSVDITATPDAGYKFKAWEYDTSTVAISNDVVNGTNGRKATFTLSADANINATFEKLTYTVRFFDQGTQIGESQTVEYGGSATAPAFPNTKPGYTCNAWDKAFTNITADTDINAVYTANDQSVTVSADPTAGGSVKIDGADVTSTTVKYDDDVTVLATANTGYKFIGWYNGDTKVSDDASYTFTCDGDVSLVAKFEIKTYTITATASPAEGGTATVNDADSVTIEHGEEVTLKAVANDGYEFEGWYVGDDEVESSATITLTANSDKDYVAKFSTVWDVTVVVPEGVNSVGYQGGNPSETITYENISDGWTSEFTASVATGYKLIGWDITKNGKTTRYNTEAVEVTIDAETIITPVVEKLYYAVVNGNLPTADDYYVKDQEVTLTFSVPTGKYLASVSVTPAMDLDVNLNKAEGKVTFTMPEADVTLVPTYEDAYTVTFNPDVFTSTTKKDYYYPGEPVEITVTPKGGHLITGITSEQAEVTYANKVITFTMPAENVTLDVEYSASFKAYSSVTTVHIDPDGPNVHTGYDNRVQGGTVTMTCNGATLAEGGFADGDVTYTAAPSTNYTFVGFYSDAEYKKFVTADTTYTVSPESDVTMYALFARRQYIKISGSSYYEMVFDRTLKAYTMTYTDSGSVAVGTAPIGTTFNNGFDIRVSYAKSGKDTVYADWGSADFHLTMNENSYARTVSWGSAIWHIGSAQANTSAPLTIIVKPESITDHNHIDVSARAKKTGATVFLSDGRYKNYNASTTILTEGVTGTDKVVGHDGDSEEYKVINLTEFKTLSWETTINHADAKYLYVDSYIVYKLESKTWEIVTPVSLGNNKYQGSVYVDGDCYIVPIFFYNEQYCTDKGYVNIELYFDASAIQHLNWGPFVAAYAWGANNDAYFGSWPGQLLIPTPDGKSFFTQMTVPKAGSANPAAGVTFNNYLFQTCPTQESGVFGLGTSNVQTYDYREAITLYESGYEVITFVAKDSEDGYHGDYSDGSTTKNTISSSTTSIKTKYTFDYLYCRDGVTPMDFTGKPVTDTEGATVKELSSADYYVVSKGDVDYNKGDYSGDSQYNGNWSVDWYIFDSNGTYKAKVLSTALWHDLDTTDNIAQTVLMTALGLTPETAAGKTIAISYDAPNNCPAGDYKDGKSHQIAYDGQWYGSMLDHTVQGQVIVGLDDGNDNFTLETDDTLNIGDFGEGYLKDQDGGLHQTLDIELDYGIADLTASAKGNYRFIGWYTKKADGTYVQIAKAPTYSTYINMNETYYAIFRELGETEVVINHRVYSNTDPAIPSHGGVGELSVEVRDSDGNIVATGPISTSASTAAFPADEGETYTVKIITTPLMKGKFFAWYTDSYKADGTKTYEEVFTEPEHIDSETTVYAEFEYTYDSEVEDFQKNITIYSDIRKVSNEAKIYYQYRNRFNDPRVYTTTVKLTDDECLGYAGNGGMEYCPTWLTWCTFYNDSTGDTIEEYVKPSEVADRANELSDQGYELVDTYNMVEALAPTEDVTEVFNGTVEWDISVNLTPKESEVRLTAKQGTPEYTITYYIGRGTDSVITDSFTNTYNELVEIDAPNIFNGKEFSYWYDETTGEIAAYTTYYNYRIVENKTLVAVYGEEVTQEWTPSINSVTYTREFGDDKDTIYTDYLLAYNSRDGKILNEWKNTDNIKYGLLVVRDSAYYISDSKNVTYPDATNAAIKEKLELVANRGSSAAFTVDNTKYNCYCYNLTDSTLTNFNRCDYYRMYDNRAVVGGSHYYREYAFTAVAYIIVDGEVFLSNPREVNFFDLGNEVPTNPVQ